MIHNDDFQIVTSSGSNSLPSNWKEAFNVEHYADDKLFDKLLQARVRNNNILL